MIVLKAILPVLFAALVLLCDASSPFCPKLHPIRDGGVYDPSGPLIAQDGVFHVWEDEGAWSHWTSTDLVHWSGSFKNGTTNFGGDTGSVSPTPSGVYAFWPIMSGQGKGSIGSAKSLDSNNLDVWQHRGPTIPMPKRIDAGFRDPVRAFQFGEKWFVGVGCGSNAAGAQFCLFEADDDTLSNFSDRGSLYTTNTTYGYVDNNIVWQPKNVTANMMECPDLFPLGDKWVLLGSLYKTNQFWVGALSADSDGVPRFTPENVGILDYGNGYAAKTGSTFKQSGESRRLLFGFTGWSEPTNAPGCGRSLIFPRELSLSGKHLVINPAPELANLRKPGTATDTPAEGSQIELRVLCSFDEAPNSGKVAVKTLGSPDGKSFLEIGFDFGSRDLYVDHSLCCNDDNNIVQRAPVPEELLNGGLNLTIFVDGALVEAFGNGRVITPLVSPDAASGGGPDVRRTTVEKTNVSVACDISSWQLEY